jgi:hypothetical protein
MRHTLSTLTALLLCSSSFAADWDGLAVPADAGDGKTWQLQSSLSDDFSYSAPAEGKSQAFYERWSEGFINAWQGPGLTDYHNPNSRVENGELVITATRKAGTNEVYTGAIHTNESVQYPVYIETSSKIMDRCWPMPFGCSAAIPPKKSTLSKLTVAAARIKPGLPSECILPITFLFVIRFRTINPKTRELGTLTAACGGSNTVASGFIGVTLGTSSTTSTGNWYEL